jgi:predicted lipoprotein with Yx(FWY)xxD motif
LIKEIAVPVNRLTVVRATAGLVLASILAACSVGATGPTAAPAAASTGPAAASQAPAVSVGPSEAPAASTAPTVATTSPVAAGGGGRYGSGATPTPTVTPKPAATMTIKSGSTALGTVLVGSDGLTLYTKSGDSSTHSTCTGSCASAWPPLLVKAGTKIKGGSGVHGAFTTFKRSDGTTQVAYKGKPLYAWTGDYYPGDTTGQGVGGFSVAKV